MQGDLDPITLAILWDRLLTVADEQGQTLFKASFSTAVGEIEDYASLILDPAGNLIAQSESTGTISMLTGMSQSVRHMLKKYPSSSLAPGDALISNDPYMFTGHKYDVTVASPVFLHDQLVALTATNLHVTDIGGIGMSASSRDTYDEGLTIPIMKLFEKGQPNQSLFELIRHNVRVSDEVIGDLMAQVAANEIGARKLVELMKEYSLPSLTSVADAIISRSEQAVRAAISSLPEGVYTHQVSLDGFDEPLTIAVALTIKNGEITADFTGTSPQVGFGINGVFNVTFGYTAHAVKCALVPDVPNNEGFFRPIKVIAPEGCLVNAKHPAPVMARHLLYSFLSAAVFGALSKVIPDKVIADSGTPLIVSVKGINRRGEPFAYWFSYKPGMGATARRDGYSGTSFPASTGTVPVEIIENVSPIFIQKVQFRQDAGGPGKYRGGCDQEISFSIRTEAPVVLSCMFERVRNPAQGHYGGQPGKCGRVVVDGKDIHPKERYNLRPGELVTVSSGGGGGFFSPSERDTELVLRDVINGFVSPEAAAQFYRVSLDPMKRAINWEETERLRSGG